MIKRRRQQAILEIIRRQRVQTQEELAELLAKRGIQATQVTLSRDIRELKLAKTPEGYRPLASAPAGLPLEDAIAEFLTDVRVAKNLVVVKTRPGSASPLAVALDQANWPEIVGTVAGDDTVLVVAPDDETALELQRKLALL
ncbi:MAG: ArgR family transcriptional regulator [Bryobacteraceae bacterium]|nr:ArgR family transcriptional regulator [Bryobacteraceae bacterium]MDW8377752.1 ArgR family transcriptional regulator [Bryobacterales bacterium]